MGTYKDRSDWMGYQEVLTMHKSLFAVILTCALAGCSSTAPTQTARATLVAPSPAGQAMGRVSAQPIRQNTASVQSSAVPELQPGPNYVASFPEADRRAACIRLKYVENTPQFSRCLVGDFTENPYFRR